MIRIDIVGGDEIYDDDGDDDNSDDVDDNDVAQMAVALRNHHLHPNTHRLKYTHSPTLRSTTMNHIIHILTDLNTHTGQEHFNSTLCPPPYSHTCQHFFQSI